MNKEVIEENKEIKELRKVTRELRYDDGELCVEEEPASAIDMYNKINELVREVNKINNESEEK